MAFEATSITGSLFGTSSWTITASRADNLLITQFNPFTGTGSITGSMNINLAPVTADDFVYGVFTGNTNITTGTNLTFSATYTSSGSVATFSGTDITLAPSSTYLIKMNFGATKNWNVTTGNTSVSVVSGSTNLVVGSLNVLPLLYPYGSAPLHSYSPLGVCLLTTTPTQRTIRFRTGGGSGTFQFHPNANTFTIEKLL